MKTSYILLLSLLVSVPACGPRKNKSAKSVSKNQMATEVDIPVAQDDVRSCFDEDLGEFALVDASSELANEEYAWLDDSGKDKGEFKKVYFDFDKYAIANTQEEAVAYDVNHVKSVLDAAQAKNANACVTIVVEGHACHSSGSALYNLALSEKRAKVLQDRLVAAGVSRDAVKIVGRGQEVPAVVNGKIVTGSRDQQALNRRDEIRVIVA
jgi:outer membrane protein OmpA-like peptidoglycan-associated protein